MCFALAAVAACGSTESPMAADPGTTETIPTHRYSGPGSFYQATIADDGGFQIDISEAFGGPTLMSITGDYVRLPTGFLEMTVRQANSSVAGAPAPGDRAYALELPGFALFFNPAGSSEVIPMLIMDACPTTDFAANWIMVRGEEGRDATHDDREWFGTFAYTHGAPASARIPSRRNLRDLGLLTDPSAAIEVSGCTDGHLPVYENGRLTANMWLTDGGAIVETFVSDGTQQALVAMRQRPVGSLADVAGDYAALFVGDNVEIGRVTIGTDGSGLAATLPDPAVAQTSTVGAALNLSLAPAIGDGWLVGQIENTANIACSALADAGQTRRAVMVCIGQDPNDPTKPLAVLMAAVN